MSEQVIALKASAGGQPFGLEVANHAADPCLLLDVTLVALRLRTPEVTFTALILAGTCSDLASHTSVVNWQPILQAARQCASLHTCLAEMGA
jgi:hypothetical protein